MLIWRQNLHSKEKTLCMPFIFMQRRMAMICCAKVNAALLQQIATVLSEFSACDASGNGNYDFSSANKWINLMNRNKISYCCWSLSNKPESASLLKSSCKKTSGFKTSDLSKMGRYIVKKYRKK